MGAAHRAVSTAQNDRKDTVQLDSMDTLQKPPASPFDLFRTWRREAEAHEQIRYAGAMCLATVSPAGWPEGRIVLLHGADERGFLFATDRRSAKGRALEAYSRAALTWYWEPLERQVRAQGRVEPASDAEADVVFAERPRRSKATPWASVQSRPLPERADLLRRVDAVDAQFADDPDLPRPPDWVAYRVVPRRIEFWEARARRLHERLLYTATEDGWAITRLDP